MTMCYLAKSSKKDGLRTHRGAGLVKMTAQTHQLHKKQNKKFICYQNTVPGWVSTSQRRRWALFSRIGLIWKGSDITIIIGVRPLFRINLTIGRDEELIFFGSVLTIPSKVAPYPARPEGLKHS